MSLSQSVVGSKIPAGLQLRYFTSVVAPLSTSCVFSSGTASSSFCCSCSFVTTSLRAYGSWSETKMPLRIQPALGWQCCSWRRDPCPTSGWASKCSAIIGWRLCFTCKKQEAKKEVPSLGSSEVIVWKLREKLPATRVSLWNDEPRYFTSLHWAYAQLGVGQSEIEAVNLQERIFSVIISIVALINFSTMISSMTSLLASWDVIA